MARTRGIVIELLGDERGYVRAAESAIATNTKLDASYRDVGKNAQIAADAQVAAALKADRAMRANVGALEARAARAPAGSREQIIAANLAADAQRKLARSYGVTAAEAATLSRHSANVERDIGKATRGALAGSGVFHGFGRSLAFASGGFLAFSSGAEFLRASVDAAREAAVAQRQLGTQMKASGESIDANRKRIDQTALSYAKFGFNSDQVTESLTVLERGTGSIDKAIRLEGLTADLARAKNIDLASAANIVAKVFGGQETALRRAVPGLQKHAHGLDLIRQAEAKLAGQAAASTTEAERFSATLHDTEVTVGNALLPTLNRYLGALDKWLQNSRNQAKIQRTVNATAKAGAGAFNLLADAIGAVTAAYREYEGVVSHLPGGKSGFLQTLFGGNLEAQVKAFLNSAKKFDEALGIKFPKKAAPDYGYLFGGEALQRFKDYAALQRYIDAEQKKASAAAKGKPLSLQARFNLDELRLAQAQVSGDTAAQRRILTAEAAILKALAAQAKTLKDRTAITQQLAGVEDQIRSIDQAALDKAKQAKDAAAARAKKAAAAAKKAAEAAKAFDVPLGLQVAEARAQALGKPVTTILQKIKATAEKALKSGRLGLQGQLDAWQTIYDVNQQLQDSAQSALGSFKQANVKKLEAGLGLTAAQRKALGARLSQLGPGGTVPGSGVGAAGYAINPKTGQPIVVHTNLHLDRRVVARSTTIVQQEHRRRNPKQRRGPHAGASAA